PPGRLRRRPRRRGPPGRVAAARARRSHPVRPRRQPPGAGLRPPTAGRPGTAGDHDPGLRMTLHVVEPGLYTMVVDRGRQGSRSLGVPVGGAADQAALAVGNALVGNPPDAAALEIGLAGPTLTAACELACVVHGAPFTLTSDRQPLTAGKTFTL